MSRQSADHIVRLSASPSIARACDELEEAVKDVVAPDFATLEEHSKFMEYERKLSRLDRLQHIGYLSDLRCKRRPVYGIGDFPYMRSNSETWYKTSSSETSS